MSETTRSPGGLQVLQGNAKPRAPSTHDDGTLGDLSVKPFKFQTGPLPEIAMKRLSLFMATTALGAALVASGPQLAFGQSSPGAPMGSGGSFGGGGGRFGGGGQ